MNLGMRTQTFNLLSVKWRCGGHRLVGVNGLGALKIFKSFFQLLLLVL